MRKSNYILEVGTEKTLPKSIKAGKVSRGFTSFKKSVISSIVAVTLLVSGLGVGIGATQENKANAVEVDLISDTLCTNITDGHAYLGGVAQPIIDGFKGNVAGAPWEGLFGIVSFPDEDRKALETGEKIKHEWTTLERYGAFGTQYTNWVGMQATYPLTSFIKAFVNGEEIPWMGTGGNPSAFGSLVWIKTPKTAPLYSHGVMECMPVAGHANVTIANMLQGTTQMTTATAINLYSISSNLSLTDKNSFLKPLGDVFELIIAGDSNTKGLKDLLFMDFMVVMLMIGAVVLAVTGLFRGGGVTVLQGGLWMLIVAITGIALLSHPLFISSIVEKTVGTATQAISSSALRPATSYKECSLSAKEDGSMRAEREIGCVIWMENVYKPWVEGQFGMSYEASLNLTNDPNLTSEDVTVAGEPEDAQEFTALNSANWAGINRTQASIGVGADLLGQGKVSSLYKKTTSLGIDVAGSHVSIDSLFGGSSDKPSAAPTREDGKRGVFENFNPTLGLKPIDPAMKNWAYYQLHTTSSWPLSTGLNFSEIAYNQLMIDGNLSWKNADDAIPSAFTGIFVSLLPNATIIILAGSLAIMQITLSFLIILAPFFFVIGLVPGTGRNVLMRWFEIILEIAVKRIILTAFFVIFLKLYFVIIDADNLNPFVQAVLAGVLAFTVITQRNTIIKAFTDLINLNTGAARAIGGEDEMIGSVKQSGKKTVNIAKNSKLATFTAGANLGAGVGLNMKSKKPKPGEKDVAKNKNKTSDKDSSEKDGKTSKNKLGNTTDSKSNSENNSTSEQSKNSTDYNTLHSDQKQGQNSGQKKGVSDHSVNNTQNRNPQGKTNVELNTTTVVEDNKPKTVRERMSTIKGTIADKAGVANKNWGNTVQKVKLVGSDARKARELRNLTRLRKEAMQSKKKMNDPTVPNDEKQVERRNASDRAQKRKQTRQDNITKAREEKQRKAAEVKRKRTENTSPANNRDSVRKSDNR